MKYKELMENLDTIKGLLPAEAIWASVTMSFVIAYFVSNEDDLREAMDNER